MQKTDLITPLAIQTPIALNGNKNIPSQTAGSSDTSSISAGFLPITSEPLDDGGLAPERTDFNGMFYLSTDQRVFLQNGGFITYDDNVASAIGGYPKGAVLGYLDSNNYYHDVVSLVDNNQNTNFNNDPTWIDNEHWAYGQPSTLSVLTLIYPVGSIFLSTTSTCPLAAFFGTWQLMGSSIITSVSASAGSTSSTSASVSVRGNGKALGLTDGTLNLGMHGNSTNGLISNTGCFNASVGTANSSNQESFNKVIGVTSDSSKSGLTGSVTIPSLSVNVSVSKTQLTANIFQRIA